MTRDEYVEAIKSSFVTIATRLTLTWAASFSGGVLNAILGRIIEAIARNLFQWLATQSELKIFFAYIDTRVGVQSKDFEDAAFNYWKLKQNEKDPKKLKAAEIDLWNKFSTFARLTS